MAMSMKEKASNNHVNIEWAAGLKAEFAREAASPNGCVGSELLSETDKQLASQSPVSVLHGYVSHAEAIALMPLKLSCSSRKGTSRTGESFTGPTESEFLL